MGSNLYIGAAGAVSRLRQLEIVSNNLANTDSIGFKADRAVFRTALESAMPGHGAGQTNGAPAGAYVKMSSVRTDFSPGPIRKTGAPLDAAIDGPGFFVVETPDGERFTRAGSFVVGPDGDLATPSGSTVLGTNGPISMSRRGLRIESSGDLVDSKGRVAGTLRIVTFEDPGVLSKEANGLFRAPDDADPSDSTSPALLDGSLEGSNVQPVAELASLIILQRAFDASMQAMKSEDGATDRLIREISQ